MLEQQRALRSLTLEDFRDLQNTLVCCACGVMGKLVTAHVSTNNSIRVDCSSCGKQHALGWIHWLKQSTKKTRKEYPFGESLEEVWERFENVCVVCGAPKAFLDRLGIPRHRHHILEYGGERGHGHEGPLVPMCGPCHTNTTERQKQFWFWFRRTGAAE